MAKTALVLCGGGSRAAFAVGVLKYIHAQQTPIQFDIFCGTGTSAIVASLAALGEINLLEKLFTSNSTSDLLNTSTLLQRFPYSNSLYNTTAFVQKINNIFTEARFEALQRSEKEIYVGALGLQKNQVTYFTPSQEPAKKEDNVQPIHQLPVYREAVLAACSTPIFMPPVTINSANTSQQYFTAGGDYYKPLELAIAKGATSIYLIQLTTEKPVSKQLMFKDLIDILERQVDQATVSLNDADIMAVKAQNNALKYIEAVKTNMQASGVPVEEIDRYFSVPDNTFNGKQITDLKIIRPEWPLEATMGGLEFVPQSMKEMLEHGHQTAKKILG